MSLMFYVCARACACDGTPHMSKHALRQLKEEEILIFKQWVSTDHADLITQKMPLSEFFTALSHQLDSITYHSCY